MPDEVEKNLYIYVSGAVIMPPYTAVEWMVDPLELGEGGGGRV